MKRILAIIMATLMLLVAFTGCNNTNNETEEATDAPAVEYAELGEGIVAKAGDYEITMEDAMVYVDLIVPYIQQSTGYAPGWEDIVLSSGLKARDELINAAIDECRYQLAFVDYAKDKGLYTDADAEAYFQNYITTVGGEEVFNEILTEYGFSEASLKNYIVYVGAYEAVINDVFTDEDAAKIYNEEYITAKHILVLFEGRETEEAAYNEALAIYNKAISGSNFEQLIEEYNEDPGQDAATGYTFTIGEMVDEFYEGAMNLKEGEISQPVKTTYGYHIIKRYANPDETSDSYDTYISTIKSAKSSEVITDEMYEEIIADYPLVINESILGSIDLSRYTVEETLDDNINYVDGSVFNE